MSDPYFQQLFAERIGGANYGKGTEIYKFEKIKRAKRKALAEHPERRLIDFGIGENDEMAAESVRRVMAEEIDKPENRGYADNGIAGLQGGGRPAHAAGVRRASSIRPREINHCIGTKTGPGHAAGGVHQPRRRDADDRARLSRGRHAHASITAARCIGCRCGPRTISCPIWTSIPADIRRRAKLLVLNYPNSPTGTGWPRASSTRG